MKSTKYLILLSFLFITGCVTPVMNGTYSQKPVSDKFIFSVYIGDEYVAKNCDKNMSACVKSAEINGRVLGDIYMPDLDSPNDEWWAQTYIHETWHPIFQWRHNSDNRPRH
jgi:hypothetical protein